jgi:hypothetical protein
VHGIEPGSAIRRDEPGGDYHQQEHGDGRRKHRRVVEDETAVTPGRAANSSWSRSNSAAARGTV